MRLILRIATSANFSLVFAPDILSSVIAIFLQPTLAIQFAGVHRSGSGAFIALLLCLI